MLCGFAVMYTLSLIDALLPFFFPPAEQGETASPPPLKRRGLRRAKAAFLSTHTVLGEAEGPRNTSSKTGFVLSTFAVCGQQTCLSIIPHTNGTFLLTHTRVQSLS